MGGWGGVCVCVVGAGVGGCVWWGWGVGVQVGWGSKALRGLQVSLLKGKHTGLGTLHT